VTAKVDVSQWLRGETPKHTELLTKLRETITASLSPRTEYDGDGKPTVTPADINEAGTPTRDWCRAYAQYRGGYEMLLAEERERAKLLVMAQRSGQQPLSDEEYQREMRLMGLEAVRELDVGQLAEEIQRRGLTPAQLVPPDDLD
jgi:hypothetical protein